MEEITKNANKRLFYLWECRRANLLTKVGFTCDETKIRPVLEYTAAIWDRLPQYLNEEIEHVQARGLRILGLSSEFLLPLTQRQDKFALREYEKIRMDVIHPCNKHIAC